MKEEEIICKDCKKPIDIEDEKIFDGYCEKCYHKWMKHKRMNTSNIDNNETTLVLYELSILCSIIAMGILIIAYLMSIPLGMFAVFDFFTLFQSNQLFEYTSQLFITIKILFVSQISFSLCGLTLGLISIKKYKHKKTKNIGLKLSIIELIIGLFLYLRIFYF